MIGLVEVFFVLVYNLTIIIGATYLIIAHDFSAWIYLLAILLLASWKKENGTTADRPAD